MNDGRFPILTRAEPTDFPAWRKYFDRSEAPFLYHGQVIGDDGITLGDTHFKRVTVVFEDGHFYLLSHKAILTISLTPVCNAACDFCYNGITFMPRRRRPDMPIDAHFDKVLTFARAGGLKNVSLSGGEPTLNADHLLEVVRRVRPDFPGFLRIHTNGSRLWDRAGARGTTAAGQPLFEKLLHAGVTDLSISRAARDPVENDRIMRMRSGASLSDERIATLADVFPDLRLSCFFTDTGVSSGIAMQNYITWGRSLGVRRFVIRLNSGIHASHALPGRFYDGNNGYSVALTRDLRDLLAADGYSPGFNRQCEDYDLYEMHKGDVHVSIDRSSDVEDPDRKIRRLLHMPDGICYTSWLQGGSALFPRDAARIASAAAKSTKPLPHGGSFPAAKARQRYYRQQPGEDVDLHVHSTLTDGLYPASDMIARLKDAGITVACFADHNAVHTRFDQLQARAQDAGLSLPFPAAEVSVVYSSRDDDDTRYKCHVLAFGEGVRHPDFIAWMRQANQPRADHLRKLYNDTVARGVGLPEFGHIFRTHDPVADLDEPKQMHTRTPLAQAIARVTGLSIDAVKAEFLPPIETSMNERQPLDMHRMLALCKRLGIATVLAHPGWVRDYSRARTGSFEGVLGMVARLAPEGLDGIELRHRQNSAEQQVALLNLARNLDMLTTGGSDYHGKPRCSLTDGHRSTMAELDRLSDRIGAKMSLRA